ncbi:MAG: diguanylate cyclase [bacterium]|nr:diguanylate cyclase [bacterium]
MRNPLRSLAARITLLVFAATILSALSVSWVSLQSLDGFLRQKVDQRFPHVANRIVQELDHWYEKRTHEVEVFAGSAILTESAPELGSRGRRGDRARDEAEQYLRYVLESFPQFERLLITTEEGETRLEVGDGEPLPDDFLAAHAKPAEHTRISASFRHDAQLVQIASAPMRDADERTIARLFALIDLSHLEALLKSGELGDSANVYIVDQDGRFLNPPQGFDEDATWQGAGVERAHASSVAYYPNPLGEEVIGTSVDFPRFDWTLVIEQSYDEAFAPIVSSMSRVAAVNLAIVFGVGLLAFRIAGSIVKPLRALSDAASRLTHGEREVEIEENVHGTEEVDLLTRTFNEMSRGLGRSARELEENQREIEEANQRLLSKNEELSNMNLVLEQLSITDGLTKLHNHRYFQDTMAAECKRASRTGDPLCLVLLDVDFFKKWNDRLGHAGGDEILRRMAEVMHQTCRETDLLARYGGEEFALLAIDTDLAGATALGEKIRQAVEETDFVTDVPSEREPLTISVGVAAYAGSRKQLFADADSALYSAKDSGRNRVVVAPPSTDGSQIDPSELTDDD